MSQLKIRRKIDKNLDLDYDIVRYTIGDDVEKLTITPESNESLIKFIHPKSKAIIKLSKCAYKDYLIGFISKLNPNGLKIKVIDGKYHFKYKSDKYSMKGVVNTVDEILNILQQMIKEIQLCSG